MIQQVEVSPTFILPVDQQLLNMQVKKLVQRGLELADIVQEAIDQSSETTHDNAPYDVARHEKEITEQRLGELLFVLGKAAVIEFPETAEEVTVGTVATLVSGDDKVSFEVAGDWHGRHDRDDLNVINRGSSVATSLLGKRLGHSVNLDDRAWTVTDIQVSSEVAPKVEVLPPLEEEGADWRKHRILFIVGPHGSGKSTVTQEALVEVGCTIIDVEPILEEAHSLQAPDLDVREWIKRGEQDHGPEFTNQILLEIIKAELEENGHGSEGVAIVGNRTLRSVDYLRTALNPSASKIIYMIAPKPILFERYKQLPGNKKVKFKDFDAILAAEMDAGLYRLGGSADHKLLNTGELQEVAGKMRCIVMEWTRRSDSEG